MENKQLQDKVKIATKWSSITEIFAKIITPITNMILARVLVPEAFGIVAIVTMIISFTDMFTDVGFQKYIIQQNFLSEKEQNQSTNVAFWTNLFISILLWILIVINKDFLASIVGIPSLGNVIGIACIQLPLTSFSSVQIALYRRAFEFRTLFITRLLGAVLPFFITIPLALLGYGYWALIIGSICGSLANAIILTVKSKWKPTITFSYLTLKRMISFSFWTLLESISIWLTLWVDILIIGNKFNQYYLGLYRNSINMVNSFMAVVAAAILPILFSALSRLQDDEVAYKNMYYTTQRFVAYLVIPMGMGVFVYRELVTQIMFGNRWSEASNIVGIWALVSSVRIIFSNFNGEVYRSKGKPKISFTYETIHLFFLVPSCLLAIRYGFWTFVYVRAAIVLQSIIIGFIIMKLIMKFSIKEMIKNVTKPIVCGGLMSLVAIALKQISNSVIWSVFSITICIFLYILSMLIVATNDFMEIARLLKLENNIILNKILNYVLNYKKSKSL